MKDSHYASFLHTMVPKLAAFAALFAAYGFLEGLALTLLSHDPLYATLAFFLITAFFSNILAKQLAAFAREH